MALESRGEKAKGKRQKAKGKTGTSDLGLRTSDFGPWTLDFSRRWIGCLVILWALSPCAASAQKMAGGWAIEMYGMVQVEPGNNVVTLGVKTEEIRFAINNVRSSEGNFSHARFLSDTKRHIPGLYIRGPEPLLDLLIKEQPRKRMLKITGFYYPDSRQLVLTGLEQFREPQHKNF